jgi:hypothetical protein
VDAHPPPYPVLLPLSQGYPGPEGRFFTCYSTVRRYPAYAGPLDLHFSGTPQAFVLSQDQTLRQSLILQLKSSLLSLIPGFQGAFPAPLILPPQRIQVNTPSSPTAALPQCRCVFYHLSPTCVNTPRRNFGAKISAYFRTRILLHVALNVFTQIQPYLTRLTSRALRQTGPKSPDL